MALAAGPSLVRRRFSAYLAVCLLTGLLSAIALITARSEEDRSAVRAQHELARAMPLDPLLADVARCLSGRVISTRNEPLEGVEVLVFDRARLLGAAADCGPGQGPSAEGRTHTDRAGRYALRGLSYGAKVVVFVKDGHRTSSRGWISLADGLGAEVDVALSPERPTPLRLVEVDGAPLARAALVAWPRHWAAVPVPVRTDAEGMLVLAPELYVDQRAPRLLLESLLLEIPPNGSEGVVTLPPRMPLTLDIDGASDGPVQLGLSPAAAAWWQELRAGRLEDGCVTLEDLRLGSYDVVLRRPGRIGRATIAHDGSPGHVALVDARPVPIVLVGPDGSPLDGLVTWWPTSDERGRERTDPISLVAARSAVRAECIRGCAWLPESAAPGGWVLLECEGFGVELRSIRPGAASAPIELRPAVDVSMRTIRPHQPIRLHMGEASPCVGETDAFAELLVSSSPGPLVAWHEEHGGGVGFPKGIWVGAGSDTLTFGRLDENRYGAGCAFGFVADAEGRPVADAEVLLEADPYLMRRTDAHGFYRFEGLGAGTFGIRVRRSSDPFALPVRSTVRIGSDHNDYRRRDFTLWPYAIQVSDVPPVDVAIGVFDGDRMLLSSAPNDGAAVLITNVPPGDYEIRSVRPGADAWSLARVTLSARVPEARLRWFPPASEELGQ